jgi:SAM-dependent methyltransferase
MSEVRDRGNTSGWDDPQQQMRLQGLLELLPANRRSILEIGSRRGFVTRKLADRFEITTALDLERPELEIERVVTVKGDVQALDFPDNTFDCVLCSEVLEHVPDVAAAAREIARVARHEIVIGVPYRQDTRVGQSSCVNCGRINPPYGHINRFDENILRELFSGVPLIESRYISANRDRTNSLSVWLQNLALNPYGDYDQQEPCIHCGRKLERPSSLSLTQRVCGAAGIRLYALQLKINRPLPTWIHLLFRKS